MIVFSFDYPPNDGGIARLCGEIRCGLASRNGTSIQVLTQQPLTDVNDARSYQGTNEIRVTAARPQREIQAYRRLQEVDGNSGLICGNWYPEGLLASISRKRPRVILAHGAELFPPTARWRRAWWPRLLQHVLESADLVVANSHYSWRLVKVVAPAARTVAIPLAVEHHRFVPGARTAARHTFNLPNDKLVLSSVSRLHRFKGHETILHALAALPPEARCQFLYLVAGQGAYGQTLQQRAEALGLSEQIRWLGFVTEAKLPDLYRASDLFLLCTREEPEQRNVEGFGLVFLEAQACGTPVVGTRSGGIPDAIKAGEGGWLIEQDDAQALTDLLSQLVHDPTTFQEMGQRARCRVERECTWPHYIQNLQDAMAQAGIKLN